MAKIIIKRREDPIFIENERAKKLKSRWLDENVPRTTPIGIEHSKGDWNGTIGDIKAIDIENEKPPQDMSMYENRLPNPTPESVAKMRELIKKVGLEERNY